MFGKEKRNRKPVEDTEAEFIVCEPVDETEFSGEGRNRNLHRSKDSFFRKIWRRFFLIIPMFRDTVTSRYQGLSLGSLLVFIIGLIYLFSPLDILPDFIPFSGLLDDLLIWILLFPRFSSALADYEHWLDSSGPN